MEKIDFSFKKGWGQVKRNDLKAVRAKIETALGVKNRNSFYYRMNGEVEPRVSEAAAIEQIFAEYNIHEVWGE